MLDFIFELLILLLQKAVDAHEKYIRSHSCYTGFFWLVHSLSPLLYSLPRCKYFFYGSKVDMIMQRVPAWKQVLHFCSDDDLIF